MAIQDILWNKELLQSALNINIPFDFHASGISIDTRAISKGNIFIAIKGENFNGNNFCEEALSKGAVSCITDDLKIYEKHRNKNLIKVDDTLVAMQKLAKFRRKQLFGNIIGITGSVGKTSTKEMMSLAFQANGKTFCNKGNFNNHIGLPISLCNTPLDTQHGIYELGMSSSGEISELTKILSPKIAIITNVQPVHLEFFSSVTDIALAKAEIFQGVDNDGYAILNQDNEFIDLLIDQASKLNVNYITVGTSSNSKVKLINIQNQHHHKIVNIECLGKKYQYKFTSTTPDHLIFNSLFIAASLSLSNVDVEKGLNNLINFHPYQGRGELLKLKNNITVIDESYNASPPAVQAAIKNLSHYKNKHNRTIAILGDMKELGQNSKTFHEELADILINYKIDKVICIGKLMKNLFLKLPKNIKTLYSENAEEVGNELIEIFNKNDVIMIKGSLSMNMKHIVDEIKQAFNS